jgi:chromosome segregation ATPase
MLLGNKKHTQKNNQNWCVILNPVKNEIDKKKIAQKISEVFSLSSEEALDLVTNTPIILLDNLTQPIAVQVKEHFRPTGAEMILTSDVFMKRKCYRTVWPNEPNLSFLTGESSPPAEGVQEEVLAADEALDEIRSLSEEAFQEGPVAAHEVRFDGGGRDVAADSDRERMEEEIRKLREECFDLREQRNQLRLQMEQLRSHELADASEIESRMKRLAEEREREVKELRALLGHAEEKHDVLKNEYREARLVYEEKMAQLTEQSREDEKTLRDLREKSSTADEEKQNLRDLLDRKEEALRKVQADYDAMRNSLETQTLAGREASEQVQVRADMLSRDLENARAEKEDLTKLLDEQTARVAALQEKHDEVQRLLELHIDQGLQAKGLAENYEREIRGTREQMAEAQKKYAREIETAAEEKRALEDKLADLEERFVRADQSEGDLRLKCQMLEDEKKVLHDLLADKDARFKEVEQDYRNWRLRAEGLSANLEAHLKDTQGLRDVSSRQEKALAELQGEYEKTRKLLQAKIDEDTRLIEELKGRVAVSERDLQDALQFKSELENQARVQMSESQSWKNQAEAASNELRVLKKLLSDERSAREQAEARQRDLEKSQIRILGDLEAKAQEAKDWLQRCGEAEKALADLRQTCEDQQGVLEKNARELESRQKELEIVRRQLRDINFQIEQRESAQRRTQLANQLTEKEEFLKNLVEQQSKIEAEIRDREDSIRQILSRQEKIEKEIVECKQARRHLMEQTKKERNGKIKPGGIRAAGPNGREPEGEGELSGSFDMDEHDRTSAE